MTDSSRFSRQSIPTDANFDTLVACAQACHACLEMNNGQLRVLSHANGPCDAQVMLVGEAPGRRGAGRTGAPFFGDRSGDRLDLLLTAAGWSRGSLFITNAILCNPLSERGTNRPPTQTEIANCSSWLARQIDVVNPRLVVALGAVALRGLRLVARHDRTLADSGGEPVPWNGRFLAAVHHPGARSQLHRSLELQREDFTRLGDWLTANQGATEP
jgi:DNA polymerase